MSREEAIKELTELLPEEFLSEYTEAIKMGIEALKQEPYENAVSRQAVLEAIEDDNRNEHYSCFATNNDAECFKQIIRELPSVTPQSCGDCISREAALDDSGLGEFHRYDDYVKMRNYLKSLPSVTPQPYQSEIPTGAEGSEE